MNPITGIVRGGRLELPVPPDWPDGTVVAIQPLAQSGPDNDDGPATPEEIARVLAAMDRVEPLNLGPAEAADLDAWERQVEEYSNADPDRGMEDVFP